MSNVDRLAGNGAGLLREIALASRVKEGLSRLYQLDEVPCVKGFVTEADGQEREALLVRDDGDGNLELALRIPRLRGRTFHLESEDLDPLCQIIEGVSHFIYLADRASAHREATQLELEVQAEVDKYVVLAHTLPDFDAAISSRLRARLFGDVRYCDEEGTELGDRYRVANDVALRFTERIERNYLGLQRLPALRRELRGFFRMGQEGKLRAARAA